MDWGVDGAQGVLSGPLLSPRASSEEEDDLPLVLRGHCWWEMPLDSLGPEPCRPSLLSPVLTSSSSQAPLHSFPGVAVTSNQLKATEVYSLRLGG